MSVGKTYPERQTGRADVTVVAACGLWQEAEAFRQLLEMNGSAASVLQGLMACESFICG